MEGGRAGWGCFPLTPSGPNPPLLCGHLWTPPTSGCSQPRGSGLAPAAGSLQLWALIPELVPSWMPLEKCYLLLWVTLGSRQQGWGIVGGHSHLGQHCAP